MLQQEGIALAVREIGKSPKAVGHCVHRSEACIGEGKAAKEAAKHRLIPAVNILRVLLQLFAGRRSSAGSIQVHGCR